MSVLDSFLSVFSIVLSFWWLYLPFILYYILKNIFETYNISKYISGLKWVLLEIKVPRDLHKSPKAMEQVFASLHVIPSFPTRRRDTIFKGKVPDWLTLEMVGMEGDTRYFVRTLESYRNFVEAQIYSQFPETEITEVPDYLAAFPTSLPNDEFDLLGGELGLTKEDAYPIRTYIEFEEKGGAIGDAKRIDPLASLAELFGSLKAGEYFAIQWNISAVGDGWIKKGQAVLDKLMGKAPKPKPNFFKDSVLPVFEPAQELVFGPPVKKEEKKEERKDLSHGTQETIKAIEMSFTKLAFNTGIRYMYWARKDAFTQGRTTGITGAFKQFTSMSLNGFKSKFYTFASGFFKESKLYEMKAGLYGRFRSRSFPAEPFVLNTEELATVFHFPDVGVKAMTLPRVEAKKGEAPSNLPLA